MAVRIPHLISPVLIAVAAVGCFASPTSRFYTLDTTATAEGASGHYAILVGPVSIPPTVDRPQFVMQATPNRVEMDELNRWAAPLDDSIARVVAGNLAILLGTPDVAVAPVANFAPTYRVTIDVQRFESVPGTTALVEAVWIVRESASGKTRAGRTVARESVQEQSFDALAAAHSRALATLSSDIAAAIRAGIDNGS